MNTSTARGARRLRGAVALSAVAIGALALAGCTSPSSASSDEKVTLRVQVAEGDEIVKMYQAIADGFEKANPNVTVKLETVADTAKNGPVVSGANPPDVGLLPMNSANFGDLAKAGTFLDLANVWENADLADRYSQSLNDGSLFNGKHYALSTNVLYYAIAYYNKDLFTKAGIEAPADHRIESADQLYQITDALKSAGVQGLGIAGGTGFVPSWMIDPLLPTAGSADQTANYLTSWQPSVDVTVKYTDEPFVSTISQLEAYANEGVFQDGYLGVTDLGGPEAQFQAGQVGMVLDGVWYEAALQAANLPFEYDWLLLPPVTASGKTQLSAAPNFSTVIPAKAAHIDTAESFLEYMVSAEVQQNDIIGVGNSIPSVNDLPESAFSSLSPVVQSMVTDASENGIQSGWTSVVPGELGQSFTNPLVQAVWAGSETPEQVGSAVQDQLMKIRGQ